jgi:hypothetical protein
VRFAKNDVNLLGHGRRFQNGVRGALAVADHGHALAIERRAGLNLRDVQDLALKILLTGNIGQVRSVGIEAGRYHHKIEVFLMRPAILLYGDGPPRRAISSRR